MGLSEIPLPPAKNPGNDLPKIVSHLPGPQSRTWLTRFARTSAPMGPQPTGIDDRVVKVDAPHSIVLSSGLGANLFDVDANRYVDLAAGFGAMLLGHSHPAGLRALDLQGGRLLQALGDVYTSDAKIGLMERLARLYPEEGAKVIIGQSGSDAVTAAMKTATLHTGRSRFISFESSYHGLSYAPLSVTNLRGSYREPFADQLLNSHIFEYPSDEQSLGEYLVSLEEQLKTEQYAAVMLEPILGRGGVVIPPEKFLPDTIRLCHKYGSLVIADEIWSGLGRTGTWLTCMPETQLHQSSKISTEPIVDLLCLGKGLGGGIPISATIGRKEVMASWSQAEEVVHTSTFAGAPLACTAALATLDILSRKKLIDRSKRLGETWLPRIRDIAEGMGHEVRGQGLMMAIELNAGSASKNAGSRLQRRLLQKGFITSTGGGERDVLVLTPPLMIAEELLELFCDELQFAFMRSL